MYLKMPRSVNSKSFAPEQQHNEPYRNRGNREHQIPYPLMPNTLLLEYRF